MLVYRVEIWPHGRESKKKELGLVRIYNTGAGTPHRGCYFGQVMRKGTPDNSMQFEENWTATAELLDFPRQSLGPWDLMMRFLVKALGHRHKRWLKQAVKEILDS